jgi:4-hydroxyphenylacetate 3-monooxygenase
LIRATLHRYSVYAFVLHSLKVANMMIEAALFNARQTGLDKQQAVQEKLALLACYREGINAHLAAAIAMGRAEPGRPLDAADRAFTPRQPARSARIVIPDIADAR